MRPIPTPVLLALLLALCALSAWQWHREGELRTLARDQASDLASLNAERDELEARTKAADAEILRLTGSLSDLRTNSVAAAENEETLESNAQLSEAVRERNTLITEQNEAITEANAAIETANATITKLAAERDDLAEKLNEVTARYNKLANPE
ncbi:hypothetical protein BH23VER1_BH23VER1_32090 [soil metagenome]